MGRVFAPISGSTGLVVAGDCNNGRVSALQLASGNGLRTITPLASKSDVLRVTIVSW